MASQQVVIMDTREDAWTKQIVQAALDVELEFVALPEGDFLVVDRDTHLIVIERKTVGDFIQSLRDGRIASQFGRLQVNYPMTGLIVEGKYDVDGAGKISYEGFHTRWSHASMQMALWSLQRNLPGLAVWWTNGLGETADVIRAIANRGRNGCFLDSTIFTLAGADRAHRRPVGSRQSHAVKAPESGGVGDVAGRRTPARRK